MYQEEEQQQDFGSIASIEESHKQLEFQVQAIKEERDALKSITQNQLKNINELQEKCEESYIAICQLPENRNIASDRYEDGMVEITKLQNKQFEINELLDTSLKEFDETMVFINNTRSLFSSEISIANQRLLIYQSNIKEIKNLSEKCITNLKESISEKKNLLKTLKQKLSNSSQQPLQEEFNRLSEKKYSASLMNNNLRQQILELENNVKTANEEVQSFEKCMASEEELLNKQLEGLKAELESSHNYLRELEQEICSVKSNIERQESENKLIKNKLSEAKMLSSNLKSSLESKNTELHAMKDELQKNKSHIASLKNIISEISQLRNKCALKETHLKQLAVKKNELHNHCSSLKDILNKINQKIIDDKQKYNDIMNETEEIKVNLGSIKDNTNKQQREFDELNMLSEEKVNSVTDELLKLTIENSKFSVSIREKEEHCVNLQKTLSSLKMDLELKEKLLTEKKEKNSARGEELNKKLEEFKLKKENLQKELEANKVAVEEKKKFNESVINMQQRITTEKEQYSKLVKSYEKEKEELKSSCNKQLEQLILNLQNLKSERTKQWEAVRDSASKAEFTYYRLKSQAQRMKAEISCLNENLKIYNCENEMLKMLIGWMNNDVSASDAESVLSKTQEKPPSVHHEVPDCSLKSDSSFDDATETEQTEDLVIQTYCMSRVHSQDATGNGYSYCVSEKPILISTDMPEEAQDLNVISISQHDKNPPLDNESSQSSEEAGSSAQHPPSFSLEYAQQNTENMTVKHKLPEGSSSDGVKMKKPKTPKMKVFKKRVNTTTKKKTTEPTKNKTILDMVIDSSN